MTTTYNKGYYGLCSKCEYYTALDLVTDLCADCFAKIHSKNEWNNSQIPWYVTLILANHYRTRNTIEVAKVFRQ